MKSILTRRQVLKMGAAAAVAPVIVPSGVFGKDAPSERIALGVIGVGGKATHGMRNFMGHTAAQVVAVCDVNRRHLEQAAKIAKVPADRQFRDFRELVARQDIDAVLIATPDHWHVLCAKAAVESGKDVYCEKPLSNTIAEGRALVEAVRRNKAVFQHGTQLRSRTATHKVCSLVRNGYIGDVKQVTIGSPPGQATGNHPPEPVPDWFDWDLFQGPAPERPYTPWRWDRFKQTHAQAAWYFISDYSKSGWVAGHGVHDIDLALWGLGIEDVGPVTIEGEGVFPSGGLFDTVLTYRLQYTFPDGRQIVMTDTGKHRHGVVFHGEKEWLFCRGNMEASNRDILRTSLKDSDVHLYESHLHERNFTECVKSRKPTITPVDVAHRATSLCLAGGICLNLGRRLQWDMVGERFLNDDQANALLSYPMRSPWRL